MKIMVSVVFFEISLLLCFSQTNQTNYSVPNAKIIGKELRFCDIETYIGSKDGIKPDHISFDLENGIIVGMVVEYQGAASFAELETALSKNATKESKHKLDEDTVVWRNENSGYSTMLVRSNTSGNVEIIMRQFLRMKRSASKGFERGQIGISAEFCSTPAPKPRKISRWAITSITPTIRTATWSATTRGATT
jgi:hypothetical protein